MSTSEEKRIISISYSDQLPYHEEIDHIDKDRINLLHAKQNNVQSILLWDTKKEKPVQLYINPNNKKRRLAQCINMDLRIDEKERLYIHGVFKFSTTFIDLSYMNINDTFIINLLTMTKSSRFSEVNGKYLWVTYNKNNIITRVESAYPYTYQIIDIVEQD